MVVALPLIEISVLALAWLCIALALVIVTIMGKLGDLLGEIPVVGGHLKGAVHAMGQAITNVLGKAEHGIDAAIGASWHLLARLMDELWHEVVATAAGYAHMAEWVARLVYAHSGLRSLVHHNTTTIKVIRPRVKTLEREFRGIDATVKSLEHDLTKGIGHDLRIGLRDLRKEVKSVEHTVTTTIPKAIDHAEAGTTALGRFIGAIPGTKYLEWAAGVVAAAVGIEVLKSLRCPSFLKNASKRGCGLWDGLEDVLGWLVDLFVIENLCDVIPELEKAYSAVAAPAISLLTKAIDDSPCVNGNQAPALNVPALHLPSNPSLVLSLP